MTRISRQQTSELAIGLRRLAVSSPSSSIASSSSCPLPATRPHFALAASRPASQLPRLQQVTFAKSPSRYLQTTAVNNLATVNEEVQSSEAAEGSAPAPAAPQWTPLSKRVGLLARKKGMVTYFLANGDAVPATVLQVDACQISAQIGFETVPVRPDGAERAVLKKKAPKVATYTALQVAATDVFSRRGISGTVAGHLRKAGIKTGKSVLREFRVSKDAIVPLGTKLSAAHFVPGQDVDVAAASRGKGFAGPMKRWGFRGQPATHGTSLTHRSHGSTGGNQDPGRVFPGKKMAGRMGGKRTTIHSLKVLRIDLDKELVFLQGNVPGPEGGIVEVTDARRTLMWKAIAKAKAGIRGSDALPEGIEGLPFPAGTAELKASLPSIVEWKGKVATAAST